MNDIVDERVSAQTINFTSNRLSLPLFLRLSPSIRLRCCQCQRWLMAYLSFSLTEHTRTNTFSSFWSLVGTARVHTNEMNARFVMFGLIGGTQTFLLFLHSHSANHTLFIIPFTFRFPKKSFRFRSNFAIISFAIGNVFFFVWASMRWGLRLKRCSDCHFNPIAVAWRRMNKETEMYDEKQNKYCQHRRLSIF